MTYKLESLAVQNIPLRNASIASQVFNVLRSAIVTMKLLPGNSLSEAEIAKQLGVSRQPVREAFIQLAKIGLLNILPQRGTYVVKISECDVANARFIREAIEVAIVERACLLATAEHFRKINQLLSAQEQAAEEADQEQFLELDDAFHCMVALSADCIYGWHIVENLKAQMDRVRFLSLPEATPIKKIVHQHRQIAQAIQAGNKDTACAAMKAHLSEISYSLPRLAERYEAMFTKDSNLTS